ncbi:hypothetical protein [Rubellicoccus peritrichatus]|uniref:Uncharacterized protein n=1 Tax=Rubellicoccus peritrichatus TaxID=3080537 RepID=A0AAQ3LHY2_9BACT|nr:hypothetical protein [Puniceicoccus sp. CR14]WOO42409.1 hypothetical protein RZN69_04855 [Puniceicoccus sp. CR14]
MAIISALLLCAAITPLDALQVRNGTLNNKRLFGIEFGNGTSFYGRHDRINSASLQTYQSGPYIVTEMVIDLASSDVALRVYHTELMNASDLQSRLPDGTPNVAQTNVPASVQKLIDRGRSGAQKARSGGLVVKDYPTSTHAKTLEYRVSEKEELQKFYKRFIDIYTQNDAPADENDDNATRVKMAGTVFVVE